MKSRLFWCVIALAALFATSCGSDDVEAVFSSANDELQEGIADAVEEDDTEDHSDDAMADDEAMADDSTEEDAMADDDAMAEEEAATEEAATEEAMADEEAATEEAATEEAMADEEAATEEATGDTDSLRIVSLSPSATEMLFAIGAGDQVVAVDSFSYFPPEAPVTDLSGFAPNIEAIAGFEPDVVVTSSPLADLDALDIENVVLPAATNLDDIYTQIEQLGALTGNIGAAGELVLQMQTDIDTALAEVPNRDVALTYYHELDNTLYSVTSGTFIGYVYSLFGLENIADPADEDGSAFGFPQLNQEFIIEADPDIIFLADTLCCEQNAETVAARDGWAELGAVQNGKVIELNDDIVSRWGPRIVEFIEIVGATVNELEPAPAS